MARPLVIVESPAKARTLAKFLGKKYNIKASRGHVRDLPKSKFGVDVDKDFEPKYVTIKKQQKVIKELKAAAKKADKVLLATDPDREGEAISWHLCHLLDVPASEPCRVVFNEITPEAVTEAMEQPRLVDEKLVDAQQARRILDRIVGYKLSPLLWKKIRYGLSAGRVQSVAIRLICDREDEINAFKPEEYWTLGVDLKTDDDDTFSAEYHGKGSKKVKLTSKSEVDDIVSAVTDSEFKITKVTRRERKKNPYPPFTTSTLQQEAARRLGFTAKKTMMVAQQLYEGLDVGSEGSVGLITYMRTDSRRISDAGIKQAQAYINKEIGKNMGQVRRFSKKQQKSQDAHEAVRPTGVHRTPEEMKQYLSRDQLRLYRLIWVRFIASQMKPAVYDTMSVNITSAGHVFRATGSQLKFDGFLQIYRQIQKDADEDDDKLLPDLKQDQIVTLVGKPKPKRHETQPPPRYNEALLVKTMEELGIGRPSTYAPIIDTILQRSYVLKEDNRFVPTALGRVVVNLLKNHFSEIIDVEFTASMEQQLDAIEEGKTDWRKILQQFYQPFIEDVEKAEQSVERQKIPAEKTEELCQKCGKNMVIKHGRYGRFLACPGYPDCKNTKALVDKTGAECPECGKEIVGRKSKRGRTFYGCSGYPDCKFVSWQKPQSENCPECNSFLVERRARGQPAMFKCSRESCDYERLKKQS